MGEATRIREKYPDRVPVRSHLIKHYIILLNLVKHCSDFRNLCCIGDC